MGNDLSYYGTIFPLIVFRDLDTLGLPSDITVTSAKLTMNFHSDGQDVVIRGNYLNVPWYWDITQDGNSAGGASSKFGWRERDDRSKSVEAIGATRH